MASLHINIALLDSEPNNSQDQQVARILHEYATRIAAYGVKSTVEDIPNIRDINGNNVGTIEYFEGA